MRLDVGLTSFLLFNLFSPGRSFVKSFNIIGNPSSRFSLLPNVPKSINLSREGEERW